MIRSIVAVAVPGLALGGCATRCSPVAVFPNFTGPVNAGLSAAILVLALAASAECEAARPVTIYDIPLPEDDRDPT